MVALLLLVEGLLFLQGARSRQADYDEGVYAASVDALRHGQSLGSDVFTSQPPGFYEILRGGSFVFGSSLGGLRALMIAFALLGCLAVYAFGRTLAGPLCGALCSATLAIAPSYSTFAGRVTADLPAAALLVVAFALAVSHRDARRAGLFPWLMIGCVVGLAFTVKLSAVSIVPALVAIAARGAQGRARIGAFFAGALIAVSVLVLPHLGALGSIWRGAVSYHVAARNLPGGGTIGGNADRVLHYLDFRTGFGWLVAGSLIVAIVVVRRPQLEILVPLLTFVVTAFVFLVWQRPLHDNHLVLFAVALALPTGVVVHQAVSFASTDWVRGLATTSVVLLLLGGYGQETRRLLRNEVALSPDLARAVSMIRRHSAAGELVVTDRPDLAHLAGRRLPGNLVDTAVLRFDSGYLTLRSVEQTIQSRQIDLVVAGRAFTHHPELMRWLGEHFATHVRIGEVTVFLRS